MINLYSFLISKKIAEDKGIASADANRMALVGAVGGVPPVTGILLTQQAAEQKAATMPENLAKTLSNVYAPADPNKLPQTWANKFAPAGAVTKDELEKTLKDVYAPADAVTTDKLKETLKNVYALADAVTTDKLKETLKNVYAPAEDLESLKTKIGAWEKEQTLVEYIVNLEKRILDLENPKA